MQKNSFSELWNNLTAAKKAGFFVWPSLAGPDLLAGEKKLIQKYKPSGFVLFKRNLVSLTQGEILIQAIKTQYKSESNIHKPIIAIDEEGGRVSRLPPPFQRGKPPLELANSGKLAGNYSELVNQITHQIFVAQGLGINCFLAPVADILTEPSNPVMGDRCFGTSHAQVSECAKLVYQTLSSHQMLTCAKHFPGHGNTTTDSHHSFAKSEVNLETLLSRELLPFQELIKAKVPCIMSAHVLLPNIDPKNPATLSSEILQNLLRNKLKFTGLVLSDDLRMQAVEEYYLALDKIEKEKSPNNLDSSSKQDSSIARDYRYLERASVDAINAGCDILLSCHGIEAEEIVLKALSQEIATNKEFNKLCFEKAKRIISVLEKNSGLK